MSCFLFYQFFKKKKNTIKFNVWCTSVLLAKCSRRENKPVKGVIGIQIMVSIEMRGKSLHQWDWGLLNFAFHQI